MEPVGSKVGISSLLRVLDLAKAQQDAGAARTISPGIGSPDFNQNNFVRAIENHIDEYNHGLGNLHREVDATIDQRDSETSALLASIDPDASALYAGYSTQLSYDNRARFVASLSYSLRQTVNIRVD